MKKLLFFSMLLVGQLLSPVSSVFAQNTPTILVDGVAGVANNINNAPYWLGAGQTLAVGNKVNAISVLQYNVAASVLQFETVVSITTSQAVPTGKVWKIESVLIDPSATIGGGGDNWGGQTVQTNATLTGVGTSSSLLGIAQQSATNGQFLLWNGTAWVPATFQTGATLTGIGTVSSPLGLAQQGATTGQNLQWNGSAWVPASFQVNSILSGNGTAGSPLGFADGTGAGQVYVTGSSPFTPALVTMGGDATISSAGTVNVNALKSATTSVNVSSAAAPANGQVLTATSPTTATWQTPSGGGTCSTAPATPGAISGDVAVCTGGVGNFFVAPVATAVSYTWTYTGSGATLSGTTNSIVISFSSSATSGNLSVTATNACGTSTSSAIFAITVNTTPISTFTASTTSPALGASVTFTPTVLDNQLYYWLFIGPPAPPQYSNLTNPTIPWIEFGTCSATLTTTRNGCNSTSTISITGPTAPVYTGHGTATFSYTGAIQAFIVPSSGVSSVTIQAYGAQGGKGYGSNGSYTGNQGGLGGMASGSLNVSPGQPLYLFVGGAGGNGANAVGGVGGWNGGGNAMLAPEANYGGAGGGGASDVRVGGPNLSNRVLVGGGGGGGGSYTNAFGGYGGYPNGLDGANVQGGNGAGGTQTAGGSGTPAGSFGQGGNALNDCASGGGGGYYGGGASNGCNSGGAGGGSSYYGGMSGSTGNTNNTRSGTGQIIITY